MAEQACSADSFVNKMGVVIHLTYKERVYYTGYETIIKPRLLELGLRHVRDGVFPGLQFYYDRINELGRAGIKFNFSTRTKHPVSDVIHFAAAAKDGIESFEGLNEHDLSGDPDWVNTVRSFQKSLYQTVKGNSSTAQYPVLAPSIVRGHDLVGDISAFVDYGNAHNYFGGNPPSHEGINSIETHLADAAKNSGSKPVVTTETGWHNALGNVTMFQGAPEQVTGKYVPRTFLEHFNKKSFRTYVYELIDQGTDQNDAEENFGLLRNDGSPKPAYTALKNLVSLLKDLGPSFSPGSLDYTLSGSTADVHKTLLQKRDGKFYLILWVEKPCYNPDTKALITVPSQQVTLDLKTPMSKVVTYLPNISTNGTTKTLLTAEFQFLVLNVPDYPIVVELTPNKTALAVSGGTGLKGEYYDNQDLTNLKLTRTDATVNFDWGNGSPHSSIAANSFSVKWTGRVQPRYSETYTFHTVSSDGVRLWVNGQLLINNWTNHEPTENSGKITLTAGQKYNIKMEFYEGSYTAVAKLLWSSPSQAKEAIPQSRLYC